MRPRVEWTSSRVAWNDGHMAPTSERQAPTPTHRLTAPANEPLSWLKACTGFRSKVRAPGPGRMPWSIGSGSTSTPGLKNPAGSNARLKAAKARRASGE